MRESRSRYVHALGHRWLTPLYDLAAALTTRERTFKDRLIREADIRAGDRVLDLGCGTGTLALRVKQAVANARIVGVDGDARVLSVARGKAAGAGVRFDRGLSFSLPYADDSFDRVLSSLFFHHLSREDKRRTLREVFRVLRPGGELHVADWGKPAHRLLGVMFTAVRILDGFENTRDSWEGFLPALLEEAGFERVSLRGEINAPLGTLALHSARKPA